MQFELKYDAKMTSTDSGVAVKDGVVMLKGYLSKYWGQEDRTAKRACGLRAVANDLQIRITYSSTASEIATDAVHELKNDVGVPPEKIDTIT